MHVAVIGAGASGLCTARHLTAPDSGFTCVVYEQTDSIGGTWVYTENTQHDQYGLPICSAMYKNLRTNLGKENMQYPGFPFSHSKSFLPAAYVLQYMKDYTAHYGLEKHIRFLCHVKQVTPIDGKWLITTVDLPSGEENETLFDAVVVCNGHYTVPWYGDFPGLTEYKGQVSHSHSYREPETYSGQTVLLCGGGNSGIDISYDLAPHASQVYLSHRTNLQQEMFPKNVKLVPVVREVLKDHVMFKDGSTSGHVDNIIMCTGYQFSFPFLTPDCGITVDDGKFVRPLYKHIVNINHPSMGFIGLPFRALVFPMFDLQVCYFLKTLSGDVKLPSKEEMHSDFEQFIKRKQREGVPVRNYFNIGDDARAYLDDLVRAGGLEPVPPVVYNIYFMTRYLRNHHLAIYRDAVFDVVDSNHFRVSGLDIPKEIIDGYQDKSEMK